MKKTVALSSLHMVPRRPVVVEYTNLLFSTTVMRAVDMPINQSVEETLEKVRTIVKQNQYKKLF